MDFEKLDWFCLAFERFKWIVMEFQVFKRNFMGTVAEVILILMVPNACWQGAQAKIQPKCPKLGSVLLQLLSWKLLFVHAASLAQA